MSKIVFQMFTIYKLDNCFSLWYLFSGVDQLKARKMKQKIHTKIKRKHAKNMELAIEGGR